MPKFQFKSYGEDAMGPEAAHTLTLASDSAARSYAGRLSKRIRGPVDIARAPGLRSLITDDWSERYITTAAPSEHHASGFRFERLT